MGRAGTVATALSFIWFHTLSDYQWPRNNDGDFDPHFYPEKTTKHSFFWKGRICAEEQLMSSPRCEGNVNLFVHCFEVQRVVFNRMKRQFLCNPFEFGSLLLFCTDCALFVQRKHLKSGASSLATRRFTKEARRIASSGQVCYRKKAAFQAEKTTKSVR